MGCAPLHRWICDQHIRVDLSLYIHIRTTMDISEKWHLNKQVTYLPFLFWPNKNINVLNKSHYWCSQVSSHGSQSRIALSLTHSRNWVQFTTLTIAKWDKTTKEARYSALMIASYPLSHWNVLRQSLIPSELRLVTTSKKLCRYLLLFYHRLLSLLSLCS